MDNKETIREYHRHYYAMHKDIKTICEYCGKTTSCVGLTRHQQGYKCKFFQLSKPKQEEPDHVIKLRKLEEFYTFWNSN